MNCFLLAVIGLIALRAGIYETIEIGRSNYLSKENTTTIQGIFVLLVLFSHYIGYITLGDFDQQYMLIRKHLGQTVVAMFLFYSGYGMMTNVQATGKIYIKKVPPKFFVLLRNFDIAILLFAVIRACQGTLFAPKQYLLSLIGWSSIGNSNWYIFAMLIMYIFFYATFSIPSKKDNYYLQSIALSILVLIYIVIMRRIGRETWWYDTVICFVAGIWYCQFRSFFEKIILRSSTSYLVCLSVLVPIYAAFSIVRSWRFLYYEAWVLLFVALVLTLTMRIKLSSSILHFFGKHVFSIYILQRIPMLLFKNIDIFGEHPYLTLMAVLSTTVLLAIVFEKVVSKIPKVSTVLRGNATKQL